MSNILSLQNENRAKGRGSSKEIQEGIHPFPNEKNVTDGGEFLDDAIRMKDQPFEKISVEENE